MKHLFPEKIFVETAAAHLPRTRDIIRKLDRSGLVSIDDHREIHLKGASANERFRRAKRTLALAVKKGVMVKEFRRHSCLRQRREYYLLHAANCPFDCSYCYLQSYYDNPVPTIFVNTDELFAQVEDVLQAERSGEGSENILFHAGETADALALEHLSGFAADAVAYFAKLNSARLELRTKSANIESILPLFHAGRTVVSWTLSPRAIAEKYERDAAPVGSRLEAASRCKSAGYPIGLRLDPLIYYVGYKEGYRELMEEIRKRFRPEDIHSIVLGAFRFPPGLREALVDRFGLGELVLGEFFSSPDGKLRYFRHIREEMYRELIGMLEKCFGPQTLSKIELAMEPEYVWRNVGLPVGSGLAADQPNRVRAGP